MDWKSFWDQPNAIYVNEAHRRAHYRVIADDLVALVPARSSTVLDHGSGEALEAERVAAACARLYLLDAAPSVRQKLAERFQGSDRVVVLAPDDLDALHERSIDLIVANSLLQYLDQAELGRCLARWRDILAPKGRLILADVIPPGVSPVTDALALLRFARQEGFLLAALGGLVRTAFSRYPAIRKRLGLAMHTEAGLLDTLKAAGFEARRLPVNLGHNQARMSFEARPA